MKIGDLEQYLNDMGLSSYAHLTIGAIGRGDMCISVVQGNDGYDIYLSNERGEVGLFRGNLTEEQACSVIITKFKNAKILHDYYVEKGLIQDEYKVTR